MKDTIPEHVLERKYVKENREAIVLHGDDYLKVTSNEFRKSISLMVIFLHGKKYGKKNYNSNNYMRIHSQNGPDYQHVAFSSNIQTMKNKFPSGMSKIPPLLYSLHDY